MHTCFDEEYSTASLCLASKVSTANEVVSLISPRRESLALFSSVSHVTGASWEVLSTIIKCNRMTENREESFRADVAKGKRKKRNLSAPNSFYTSL